MRTLFVLIFLLTSFCPAKAQFYSLIDSTESSFTYTSDFFWNIKGGLETGYSYIDNIDVELSFQIKAFDFKVHGIGTQGGQISAKVGDIQGLSNIEAETSWRLYEAWTETQLHFLNTSVLLGVYDYNSEFDVSNTGILFINSSHGTGPELSTSGVLGPSTYPLTSLAGVIKINPFDEVTLKFGAFDAIPSDPLNTQGTSIKLRKSDGLFFISEFVFSKSPEIRRGRFYNIAEPRFTPFRFVIGGWKYSKERTGWLGEPESDHGLYAITEFTTVFGFKFFTRAGVANRDINRYNYYLGSGITFQDLVKTNHKIGLAISLPINSDDFIQYQSRNGDDFSENEMSLEFTYLAPISSHVSFQFDAQYIQNPNQAPGIEDALVFGLRSVFKF